MANILQGMATRLNSQDFWDRVQQIILQKLQRDPDAENPGISQPATENDDPSTSGDDIQEDETTPEDDKMDHPPPTKKQKNANHSDQKGVSTDVASKKVGMYLCLV